MKLIIITYTQVISSLQCSPYVNTLNPCIKCSSSTCHSPHSPSDSPFAALFAAITTPMIFACDGSTCVWSQTKLFEQELLCETGICVDDASPVPHNIASFVILFAFVVLLLSIVSRYSDKEE